MNYIDQSYYLFLKNSSDVLKLTLIYTKVSLPRFCSINYYIVIFNLPRLIKYDPTLDYIQYPILILSNLCIISVSVCVVENLTIFATFGK